jgi:hypothetical protein
MNSHQTTTQRLTRTIEFPTNMPRPAAVADMVQRFETAVIAAVSGRVSDARTALAGIDTRAVRDFGRSIRAPGLRPVRPPTLVGHRVQERVLLQGGNCCWSCGSILVSAQRLVNLAAIVGRDAMTSLGSHNGSGRGTLVHGAVRRTRFTSRQRADSPPVLVAVCRACQRVPVPATPAAPIDPTWTSTLRALDGPTGTARCIVERAVLLDGSTLNLSGAITGGAAPLDPPRLAITRGDGGRLEHPVEVHADGARTRIWTHVSLLGLLGTSPTPATALQVELLVGTAPMELIAIPGFDASPNAAIMTALPPVASLGIQLSFDVRTSFAIGIHEFGPTVAVDRIITQEERLLLRLSVSPPVGMVTSAWLRERTAEGSTPGRTVHLEPSAAGEWVIDPLGPLAGASPADAPSSTIYDVWAEFDLAGEQVRQRVACRQFDLVSPRSAVTLPTVRARTIRLSPYFTIGRNLALKMSTGTIPPTSDT